MKVRTRLPFLVPEVVQASAMDCGPASLKCLLEGVGVNVSYERLRDACRTDVDGTSIDTLEAIACQLGLEAEQTVMPLDLLLMPEAALLPAIVVTRLPAGLTHFVLVWRRHGRFVQLMDPATGRRWQACRRFLDEVYVHRVPVGAENWREWAGGDPFLATVRRRLADLGVPPGVTAKLVDQSLRDTGWHALAALDASTRMVHSIVASGGLGRGERAARLLQSFFSRARTQAHREETVIPEAYWSVRPAPPEPDGGEQIWLRGAVLVSAHGARDEPLTEEPGHTDEEDEGLSLSQELVESLEQPSSRPAMELLRFLREDGLLGPLALSGALLLAAAGLVVEALFFRGIFALGAELRLTGQRLGAVGSLAAFVTALLFFDWILGAGLFRVGRRLETRLRCAILRKLPRLGDRYFQSRLTSDLAERTHALQELRLLALDGGQFLRSTFELILTTAAIAWLAPASAPVAIAAATLAVGIPLAAQPVLLERDLRLRSHAGALSRFYLDGLLGLVAVRVHGAERAVRREHEQLLVEWARSGLRLQTAVIGIEALQSLTGFGLAAWLVTERVLMVGEPGGVLLLVYWALNLAVVGNDAAMAARRYPAYRNRTLRLLEPLRASDEAGAADAEESGDLATPVAAKPATGALIVMEAVTVKAGGQVLLDHIDVAIEAGQHVAIVGPSGAGKSSLVGTLLGWHRPSAGRILVDARPLEGARLEQLRRETAWVDPSVHLWNRSLLDNLVYGAPAEAALPLSTVLDAADLRSVLERLPDGLQTGLGEGGALVSGGQGQRVRLGRALFRPHARLVILDEAFRGLEQKQRRDLLARCRELWRDATLLCITHDVGETMAFDRVLVIEGGRLVEDGAAQSLAFRPDSIYRKLLQAEAAMREKLWSSRAWRRLRLLDGRLIEDEPMPESRGKRATS